MLDNESGTGVTLQTNCNSIHCDSDFYCRALRSHSDDSNELDRSESRTYKNFQAENAQPSTSKVGSLNFNTQTVLMSKYCISYLS